MIAFAIVMHQWGATAFHCHGGMKPLSDRGDSCLRRVIQADRASSRTIAAHFSPIMIEGALVLPPTTCGMIEASATRRPLMPSTHNRGSTTASLPAPILQVPTGCRFETPRLRMSWINCSSDCTAGPGTGRIASFFGRLSVGVRCGSAGVPGRAAGSPADRLKIALGNDVRLSVVSDRRTRRAASLRLINSLAYADTASEYFPRLSPLLRGRLKSGRRCDSDRTC